MGISGDMVCFRLCRYSEQITQCFILDWRYCPGLLLIWIGRVPLQYGAGEAWHCHCTRSIPLPSVQGLWEEEDVWWHSPWRSKHPHHKSNQTTKTFSRRAVLKGSDFWCLLFPLNQHSLEMGLFGRDHHTESLCWKRSLASLGPTHALTPQLLILHEKGHVVTSWWN